MKKKHHAGFKIFKTYRFTGQDPAVRKVLRLINDDQTASENSGVGRSTFRSWRRTKDPTRRPQHATLEAAARSAGKKFVLVDLDWDDE